MENFILKVTAFTWKPRKHPKLSLSNTLAWKPQL